MGRESIWLAGKRRTYRIDPLELPRRDGHLVLGCSERKEVHVGRRSTYPAEFRRADVELVRSSGRPIAEVARSLDILDSKPWNLVKADRAARARTPECLANVHPLQAWPSDEDRWIPLRRSARTPGPVIETVGSVVTAQAIASSFSA